MKNRFVFFIFTLCFFAMPFVTEAKSPSHFTMSVTRSDNLKPFPKWMGMRKRFGKQSSPSIKECDQTSFYPCSVKDWKRMINSIKGEPLKEQLKIVNRWANTHPYIVDQLNWGMEDFWETPHEFLSVSGDCEDYAITKYYSLRALGVPESAMRIIIVQDLNLGGIIHAILGVYDNGELIILDNQIKQTMPAMKIFHYLPIYALNAKHWWAYYKSP